MQIGFSNTSNSKCYKLTRAYELVLTRNPVVGPYDLAGGEYCNWNIQWANNGKIEEMPQHGDLGPTIIDGDRNPVPCSELNCPTTVTENGPTITITNLAGGPNIPGQGPAGPMPDLAEICNRTLGNAWRDQEMKIRWKYKKVVTGCSDVLRSHIWPFSVNVGSLWSIANDLFCRPQSVGPDPDGLEEDAEETWKKILACLCKIEEETDPAKKKEMQDNLVKNLTGCAEKWNKNASRKDKLAALTEGQYMPHLIGVGMSDEWIEDQTSMMYQECLSAIDDFCE